MEALTVEKIIPINRFNRGEAGKIFKEVKSGGVKYVFKNNLPECVLLSPEYYNEMVERIIDMELYIEALEREAKTQKVYSEEEVLLLIRKLLLRIWKHWTALCVKK